jgi:hypothetical protein
MRHHELAAHAAILAVTAREAAEELDAVREHPQVIDALRELGGYDRLGDVLNGAAGDDPRGYVRSLADDLEPFREKLMDDEPELVERLITVAAAVQRAAASVPA